MCIAETGKLEMKTLTSFFIRLVIASHLQLDSFNCFDVMT